MNKNNIWFTLIEIVITLSITSIIFTSLALILPNLSDTFISQKEHLNFQQNFTLDNFYLNNKIINSEKILNNYSSGTYNKDNSYLTLLNNEDDLNYSIIYLWSNTWSILETDNTKWNIIVKNTFFYSDYVKVWSNDIYYTNPWEHSIYKYNILLSSSSLAFWEKNIFWYNDSWIWLFNTPTWITYNETSDILYIADSWNNVIRSINLSNWDISTIAWNNLHLWYNIGETNTLWTDLIDSLLDYPTWLEYYNDSIYISDTYNNRVRKIDLSQDKIYTLFWSDNFWFNNDNWIWNETYINYPLSIVKISNWIIFWDTLNWKIRYYNENDNTILTILWIEKLNNNFNINIFSKYSKNYYNSYIQAYSNWFYFNDLKNWIIYDYNFWINSIIWDNDDVISNILWNLDKNILINWDIENNITSLSSTNDLIISDTEIFAKTSDQYISPLSWNSYLTINTKWKTASWTISFTSNVNDWEIIQISDKIFEFDDWLLLYEIWNIVIPIWDTLNQTIENLENWLYNNDIKNTLYWESIQIFAKDIWTSWNNTVFSWSSDNYSLLPTTWTLLWWIEYSSWTKQFEFKKNLITNWKYKLVFYTASDESINTSIIEPLLTINTWTWNIEEKILNTENKWSKKEIVFNWNWNNQNINFIIKDWEQIYIDYIQITSIWDIQLFDFENKNKFQIWILNSFFILDSEKILLNNTLDKELLLIYSWWLDTINENFSMYDFKSSNLNLQNDYKGESIIKNFQYTNNNNNLIYNIWIDGYSLKISNNIK